MPPTRKTSNSTWYAYAKCPQCKGTGEDSCDEYTSICSFCDDIGWVKVIKVHGKEVVRKVCDMCEGEGNVTLPPRNGIRHTTTDCPNCKGNCWVDIPVIVSGINTTFVPDDLVTSTQLTDEVPTSSQLGDAIPLSSQPADEACISSESTPIPSQKAPRDEGRKVVIEEPIYIGVDPGASGGIIYLWGTKVSVNKMPETEGDIWDYFQLLKPLMARVSIYAVIEKVGGFIGANKEGAYANVASAHTMFNFGMNYGLLRMAIRATGIPFEDPTPQKWQRALGIPSRKKGEGKTELKNRLKAKAQQLFPLQKVTLATADALLLAEYCRRSRTGTL